MSSRIMDLSGRKFSRLTVIELAGKRGHRICWKCMCECGNVVIVEAPDLLP